MRRDVEVDRARYLEMSAKQVERMCDMMSSLQDLLIAKQYEAVTAEFDMGDLLHPIVEDLRLDLEPIGIEISWRRPEVKISAVGDLGRTEQAVRSVLGVAQSISCASDRIEVRVESTRRGMEICVQNSAPVRGRLSSSDRLGLSSAEAGVISQQGIYEYFEDPFCVRLVLPGAERVPQKTEAVAVSTSVFNQR